MILTNNTILITGGSSGLGLELAERLIAQNNTVLICGRSLDKLEKAKKKHPKLSYFQCDISKTEECKQLEKWITNNHPKCNILINNAAIVHQTNFKDDPEMIKKSEIEIQTNFIAPIVLSKIFIPIILKNKNPKIINITTGLVYTPKVSYPIYNATKSGLHAFTQVLRSQLKTTPIAVIEVLFPAVDTPWHKGNAPSFAISTSDAIDEMITSIENKKEEIKIGKVKLLYWISRIAPKFAFKKLNSAV